MLTFIRVFVMRSDDNPAESLFFTFNTLDAYIAKRKEQLRVLVTFCSSPCAEQYHYIGQPLEVLLRRNLEDLKTRCMCTAADLSKASCLTLFRKVPTVRSLGVADARYSKFAATIKSEYEMRCCDQLV